MNDMDHAIDPETLLAQTGWLRGFARSLVLDDSRADDVFQQTLLTAIERPPRERRSLGGWLATVARNAARQIGRSEGARGTRERAAARDEAIDDVSSVAQKAELQRNLVGGVLELGEPYRTVLLLRYFEDLSPADIASRLKRPAATVRSQLKRGLERLRRRFDAERGGDRQAWMVALLPLLDLKKSVAGGVAAAGTGGAIAMSISTKMTLVVAFLVLLGGGIWFWEAGANGNGAPGAAPESPREEKGTTVALGDPGKEKPEEVPTEPEALEIPTGGALVRVTAGNGVVPGAEVRVVHENGATFRSITDQWGRAVLDAGSAGVATVWLFSPERGRKRYDGIELTEEETALSLPAGARVKISFVDLGGEAVPAAAVRRMYEDRGTITGVGIIADEMFSETSIPNRIRLTFGPRAAWTLTGTFRFAEEEATLDAPLAPGRWRLFFSRPGSVPHLTEAFEVSEGNAVTVPVKIPWNPQTGRVRLVRGDNGEPLRHATITPIFEHGDDQAFLPAMPVTTDANGEAVLPLLGEEKVKYQRPPTWWAEKGNLLCLISEHQFADPEAQPVKIKVYPSATVIGKAYLSSGKPAAGRVVMWRRKGREVRTTAAEDGSFTLAGLPVGSGGEGRGRESIFLLEDLASMKVVDKGVSFGPGETVEVQIGEPADGLKYAALHGRITFGESRPVAGAAVLIRRDDGGKHHAITDAHGRYRIDQIKPGTGRIRVYTGEVAVSDDFGFRSREAAGFEAGDDRELNFKLPEGAMTIIVLDAETGSPIQGAYAGARPMSSEAGSDVMPGFRFSAGWVGSADAEGKVFAPALVPGEGHTVMVMVRSGEYENAEIEDQVPGTFDEPAVITIRLNRKR